VLPLLRSVRCDLHALAVNAAHDHLILDDLASSLAMKAEYVDLCRNLIDRAPHDELRDATLPTLGSARCLLHSLGLTVPRDIIQEGLASALAGLAEQIEACRDRVDRATRDR
jgi:hypothetical protein